MDLDSYIARYTSETRLKRLLSVAAASPHQGKCGGNFVELAQRQQALKLAERQMRRDGNVLLYREIFGGGEGVGRWIADHDPKLFEGPPPFDAEWANETESFNCENRHVLEGRLSTAQSRLHKDAIRIAYLALAEHDVRTGRDNHKSMAETMAVNCGFSYENSGNVDSTQKHKNINGNVNSALFRAMDFCATRLQTAQIGLLIIESAINAGDYITVNDYTERLGITMKSLRSISVANGNNSSTDLVSHQESVILDIDIKVQIAKGIERMVSGDYAEAAKVLVPLVMRGSGGGGGNESNDQHQNNSKDHHMLHWPGVTAPEDVALYASLMCLVTRDRSKMLALADHPEALELVPAVKELLLNWSRANYAPCMRAILEYSSSPATKSSTFVSLSQSLLPLAGTVDIYLTRTHWNALVQTIRETCLVEYLRPYQRVKLESIQNLFFSSPTSVNYSFDSVIDALADLVDRRLLPPTTRLDCCKKILFQTEAPFNPGPNICVMEERVLDDSHAMLVRLSCLDHALAITSDVCGNRKMKVSKTGEGASATLLHRAQQRHHMGSMGRKGPGAMTDCSDSEDDGVYKSYEDQTEARVQAGDMGDTHMIDADPPSPSMNADMNPEDMY